MFTYGSESRGYLIVHYCDMYHSCFFYTSNPYCFVLHTGAIGDKDRSILLGPDCDNILSLICSVYDF